MSYQWVCERIFLTYTAYYFYFCGKLFTFNDTVIFYTSLCYFKTNLACILLSLLTLYTDGCTTPSYLCHNKHILHFPSHITHMDTRVIEKNFIIHRYMSIDWFLDCAYAYTYTGCILLISNFVHFDIGKYFDFTRCSFKTVEGSVLVYTFIFSLHWA